ncbi:HEAT repeat domain-containing protein [Streptomyces sp. WMMC897]|uniref:HEAT repeat domain-containing protein n=1 Tax=Streptomyces sp. WMMC897 TaxID=3014782 RepID=UPI0022B69D17|nr:HEAT repeat domain-containing protein [Streptomyces sp. WMMC897]MCZ7415574.1 HEAT repeat domain-containing protein [Streptomyces sp. WMMC897]
MFAENLGQYAEPDIAPSGTLLGLLQRGRGDGTLHALAAPRPEALAALHRCLADDPRRNWQVEHRSLYYARLHRDLDAGLDAVAEHLFSPQDHTDPREERTGLALSVLGHLASYGNVGALRLLREYAARGTNWQWALDELAVRDDDAALRRLGPAVLARFPRTAEGEAELALALRDSFEPRPWRLWEEDPARPEQRERLARAREQHAFDRWSRQLRSAAPRPGWSVREVLAWAEETPLPPEDDAARRDFDPEHARQQREAAAARCLAAVAGPEDRPGLLAAARGSADAARVAALRHLAERGDPEALDLIEAAVADGTPQVAGRAAEAFARMRGLPALERARRWAGRDDVLGAEAAAMLACRGSGGDARTVLAALRRTVRSEGCDTEALWPLVDGVGRLNVTCAAPVLRHIYRETTSSQLRGRTARALAATDPSFAASFAVECLWDCEESTRELAAHAATTGDDRVVERLRRLAADPAEEAGVQSAVLGRLRPGTEPR